MPLSNPSPRFFNSTPITFDKIKSQTLGLAFNHVMTIATYSHQIAVKRIQDEFILFDPNDALECEKSLSIEYANNHLLDLIKNRLSINDNSQVSCIIFNNYGETVALQVRDETTLEAREELALLRSPGTSAA